MSVGLLIRTWLYGECVGMDAFGNRYYRRNPARRWPSPKNGREPRWVLYKDVVEASLVPPEWHSWLHHTSDAPPSRRPPFKPAWVLPHLANRTGTADAWHRHGSSLRNDRRRPARGDYVPWSPQSDPQSDPQPDRQSSPQSDRKSKRGDRS